MLSAGVDEVGRGTLAGPVVAVACILPDNFPVESVTDSKLLTPKRRESLFSFITTFDGVRWAQAGISAQEIDQINIHQATLRAMRCAIEELDIVPDHVFIDGLFVPSGIKMKGTAIVGGDAKCPSISAASILAKVLRDRLMCDYHHKYPAYHFDKHKGYGTKDHLVALHEYGPCEIHRLSFEPIKSLILNRCAHVSQ